MVALNQYIETIEVLPEQDGWIVRVTENGKVDEIGFRLEDAARSYADRQKFRLPPKIFEGARAVSYKKSA